MVLNLPNLNGLPAYSCFLGSYSVDEDLRVRLKDFRLNGSFVFSLLDILCMLVHLQSFCEATSSPVILQPSTSSCLHLPIIFLFGFHWSRVHTC